MALTAATDVPKIGTLDQVRVKLKADAKLYVGGLVSVLVTGGNAGYAIAAKSEATLQVVWGICLGVVTNGSFEPGVDADNTDGSNGDVEAVVARGIFKFENSSANAITQAHVGQVAYAEDDAKVANTGTVIAGRILTLDSEQFDGVWVDTREVPTFKATTITLASSNGTAAGAADQAALKAETEKLSDDFRALLTILATAGLVTVA